MIFNRNSSTKNVITFQVSDKQIESLQRYCADENLPFDGRNVRKNVCSDATITSQYMNKNVSF